MLTTVGTTVVLRTANCNSWRRLFPQVRVFACKGSLLHYVRLARVVQLTAGRGLMQEVARLPAKATVPGREEDLRARRDAASSAPAPCRSPPTFPA
jgi:hypothetical protein